MLAIVLLHLFGSVWSFEKGGPKSVCADPVAWHGVMPQTTVSPVKITAPARYTLGGTIQVSLVGTKKFEGFMLGAKRVRGDTEELLGTWESCSGGPAIKKEDWFPGTGVSSNCITQATDKSTSSMVCNWKAPPENAGEIYFRAAIVTDYKVLWLNVKSNNVLPPVDPLPAGYVNGTSYTADYFGDLTTASCGSSKGCVRYPRGCSGASCSALVAYSVSGGNLDVHMKGKASGYISVGFSSDAIMGDDETFTCGVNPNNNQVEVQRGVNVGYVNMRMRYTVMTVREGKSINGYIICRFVVPLDTSAATYNPKNKKPLSLTFKKGTPQYVFFAVGDMWPGTSAVQKHVQSPLLTTTAIDLKSTTSHVFDSLPTPVRVHGLFMILAWFGLALPFAQLPAHMRNNIGMNPMWRSWIRLHIGGMVATVATATVGVITILVFRKGVASPAVGHAVLGLLATVLGILQLVMGFLRPSPGTPKKPIFDLVHLVNAAVITLFTVISTFLGFNMTLVQPYFAMIMNIIIGVTVAFNVISIILFRLRRQMVFNEEVKRSGDNYVQQMSSGGSNSQVHIQPSENPAPARPQMTNHLSSLIFVVYVAINSVLVVIAIILLFLF